MTIDVPDHYAPNVGGAMVHRAAEVIMATKIVPAWLHQFADLWSKGLRYDGKDVTFWQAVYQHDINTKRVLERAGVLEKHTTTQGQENTQ